MNWIKNGNLAKVVAFFVIAVVLTCTVAYATGGWQLPELDPNSGNNGEANNQPSTDQTDEDKDGTNNETENEDIPVVKPIPEYLHYLTGKEITLEQNYKKPLCFAISSDTPVYGISSAFMVAELPTEDGKTRFLCFTDEAGTLGKIGSIAPTRDYISRISTYFGGVLIANGKDDKIEYGQAGTRDSFLDLSQNIGFHYTEYGEFVYSNADLITALLKNSTASTVKSDTAIAPYLFVGYYDEPIFGEADATSLIISYASGNSTELSYSHADGDYTLSKNGSVRTDLLNDKICLYENVFVLYSDSTTYETADYTQSILNTSSGGKGQYLSKGKMINMTWSVTKDGSLIFLNESGEKLIVNRGNSYISFVKSSKEADVVIK